MSYLITGATGAVGRHIVNELVATGVEVHALSRKPDQANLPAGVRMFKGDLSASDLQEGVFDGVKGMFLFPAYGDLKPFLGKAKAAGVEHVVVLSSLAAAAEFPRDLNSPSYHHHRAVERAVEASGMAYTFLRPGSFANNLGIYRQNRESRVWSLPAISSGPHP
jgi:uncharacterized protein YbjT (DUF2867 family)